MLDENTKKVITNYQKRQTLLRYSNNCGVMAILCFLKVIIPIPLISWYLESESLFFWGMLGVGYMGIMFMALAFILTDKAYRRV